jgi:hypothetical protein
MFRVLVVVVLRLVDHVVRTAGGQPVGQSYRVRAVRSADRQTIFSLQLTPNISTLYLDNFLIDRRHRLAGKS